MYGWSLVPVWEEPPVKMGMKRGGGRRHTEEGGSGGQVFLSSQVKSVDFILTIAEF